jgi:hypothetical protein
MTASAQQEASTFLVGGGISLYVCCMMRSNKKNMFGIYEPRTDIHASQFGQFMVFV